MAFFLKIWCICGFDCILELWKTLKPRKRYLKSEYMFFIMFCFELPFYTGTLNFDWDLLRYVNNTTKNWLICETKANKNLIFLFETNFGINYKEDYQNIILTHLFNKHGYWNWVCWVSWKIWMPCSSTDSKIFWGCPHLLCRTKKTITN